MDNVKPVQKWADGGGALFETELEAIQSEARRIVRIIVCDAVDFGRHTVDVEALADRRTALIDALRKIERNAAPTPIVVVRR
jgi:hypothetical protein